MIFVLINGSFVRDKSKKKLFPQMLNVIVWMTLGGAVGYTFALQPENQQFAGSILCLSV